MMCFDVWPKIGLPILSMLLISAFASAQQKSMPPRTQDRPLQERIESMERAQRDEWQKPDEVVKALELKPGDVVADVGAGSGYFTRRIAKAVALGGKVYAVDVAADILGYLKERADREGLRNIVTIVSQPGDPMLPRQIRGFSVLLRYHAPH
jgi:predicted methyltransferase